MRKKFVFMASLGCFAAALYFMQEPLMVWGAKKLISSAFPPEGRETLTYEKAQFKKGHLVLSGVRVKQDNNLLLLDELQMKVRFDLKKWAFEPQVSIQHPNLQLGASDHFELSHFVKALKPGGFYHLKMDVEHGVLQLEDQRFYFSFESGKNNLGTLRLSLDPSLLSHPFLVVSFEMRGGELYAQLKMSQVHADQVLKLLAMTGLDWAKNWRGTQGVIDLSGHAILTSNGGLKESSAQFSLSQIELMHTDQPLSIRAQNLVGSLHLTPESTSLWKGMHAAISMENGHVELKDRFALTDISGQLAFDPSEDPAIALTGKLGELPFSLDGKGAMHEDQTYWLECGLQFAQENRSASQLFVSLCSPEAQELILQLELKQCRGAPLALLQMLAGQEIQLLEGAVDGKGIARFRKGDLVTVEIEQIKGRKWQLGLGDDKRLLLHEVALSGQIAGGKGEMNVAIQVTPKERINATVKCKKNKLEVSGLFEGADQTHIQFGFTSRAWLPKRLSELSDGWLRSSHIGPAFYASIVKRIDPDLDMYGTFDMFGTFDGKELELSLQCESLIARTPYYAMKVAQVGERDPMLLKTKGRAKIHYYPEEKRLEMALPLRSASFFEKSQGVLLENFNADLIYTTENGFSAQLEQGEISFDGKSLLQEVSAQIAGHSPRSFKVADLKAKMHQMSVKASEIVFDEKGIASLKAELDEMTVSALRQGESLNVKALLKAGELDALIHYEPQWNRAQIEKLHFNGPKGELRAEGDLIFDMTDGDLPFSIRAEVALQAKVGTMELSTKRRAQVAFAPGIGLEVSKLDLAWRDYSVAIEQLEMANDKVIARGCKFGNFPCMGLMEIEKENFVLTLSDADGALLVSGKWDGAVVEKAEGTLSGLACKLRRSGPDQFKGTLELDTHSWSKHLPKELQKLPQGRVSLNGEFTLAPELRFIGHLNASGGTLHAKVELDARAIECTDFLLEDATGRYKASKASLRYIPERNAWGFVVPHMQLANITFSALPGVSLPKAHLRDFIGVVGNVDSWSSHGSFTFKAKAGALAEKFHLDAAMDSPSSGEIEYEVKNGKCLLTALRNVYSEGKQAQFALRDQSETSFDLNGNLFMNFSVKKETKKSKKPIAITVRGTLDQPVVTTR